MREHDYLRYSCQIALPGFGRGMQDRLLNAKVLVVGMGGLGCPAAQYLVSSGIGTIGIVDHDRISEGNLHRQILYRAADIGKHKTAIAQEILKQQNPEVEIKAYDSKVHSGNVMELIQPYDIVLDCTDNFETKYLLNDACVLQKKPLVFAAIYQYEGQLAVWNVANEDGSFSPHYRDLFPEVDAATVPNCAEGGVIPTLAGIMGCMQANEALKYFVAPKHVLKSRLLMYDALSMQSRIIKIGDRSKHPINGLEESISIPSISVKELKINFESNTYHLLDVRKVEERKEYTIGGQHIPLHEIEERSEEIDWAKPLVLYCASGKRSAEAYKKLHKKYPEAILYSLEGGLKAWKEYKI